MSTEWTPESLHFQKAHGRDVVARFDGGTLTSAAPRNERSAKAPTCR